MRLQEKPKIGEFYRTSNGGVIKIVKHTNEDNIVRYIRLHGVNEHLWNWTIFYCEKLSSLEKELL